MSLCTVARNLVYMAQDAKNLLFPAQFVDAMRNRDYEDAVKKAAPKSDLQRHAGVAAPTGTPGQSSGNARSGSVGPQPNSAVSASAASSPAIPPVGGVDSVGADLPADAVPTESPNIELGELVADLLREHFPGAQGSNRDGTAHVRCHCRRAHLVADWQSWRVHAGEVIAERIEKAKPPAPFTFGDLSWAAGVIKAYVALVSTEADERRALANRLADASEADPNP